MSNPFTFPSKKQGSIIKLLPHSSARQAVRCKRFITFLLCNLAGLAGKGPSGLVFGTVFFSPMETKSLLIVVLVLQYCSEITKQKTRSERVRKCVPFAFHLRSNLRSTFTGTIGSPDTLYDLSLRYI